MISIACNIKMSNTKHASLRKSLVLIFAVVTTALFFYLNKVQRHYYIDEIFHIPQTLRFCGGNFTEWDEKITTFPGLYLIATAIFAPFHLCGTIFFRALNLVGTFFNFYVIYELVKFNDENAEKGKKKRGRIDEGKEWKRLITGLNIALLPPLYFLLFLYYTDVISTNLVLLMYLFYLKGKFKTSALIAAFSVLLRQTNIVWVAWLCLERGMDIIENKNPSRIHESYKNTPTYFRLLWENTKEEFNRGRSIKFIFEIVSSLFSYVLIGSIFILFVILNEGIVLGDRSAHQATIHLPQIFYFSIFLAFFSWPYFLPYVKDFLKFVKNRWVFSSIAFLIMGIVVRYNTLVHPYLLADNRHYTFYVWNRTIGRYYLAKYALVPFYAFCLYSAWRGVGHLRFLSKISYFLVSFIVLVPQLLLEPRYFFIPYIIFRVRLRDTKWWQIWAELVTVLFINAFQFYVFSNKVFYWEDDVNPQRISW